MGCNRLNLCKKWDVVWTGHGIDTWQRSRKELQDHGAAASRQEQRKVGQLPTAKNSEACGSRQPPRAANRGAVSSRQEQRTVRQQPASMSSELWGICQPPRAANQRMQQPAKRSGQQTAAGSVQQSARRATARGTATMGALRVGKKILAVSLTQ